MVMTFICTLPARGNRELGKKESSHEKGRKKGGGKSEASVLKPFLISCVRRSRMLLIFCRPSGEWHITLTARRRTGGRQSDLCARPLMTGFTIPAPRRSRLIGIGGQFKRQMKCLSPVCANFLIESQLWQLPTEL